MAISASEAHYLVESCLADLRPDGRGRLEHRPYSIAHKSTTSEIDARDVSSSPALILSNGSSRVHLPGSSTDVLCSVKADLVHPSPSKPNEGVVELGVDLSLCGGGGTIGGAGGIGGGAQRQRRQRREEESQISSLLQRLVLPHAVDYGKLAVWPGKYVWRLAVDVVVVRCDGCVLDAASIAIREALGNTRLPKVSAVMEGNDDGGGSSRNDLMVDGDTKKAVPPAGAENCPLVVTVSVLTAPHSTVEALSSSSKSTSKRRRHVSIVDARAEEEACASSRVCVSVDASGNVSGVHTLGGGGVVLDESGGGGTSSIPMAMLGDVVSSAATAAGRLYKLLEGERGGDSEGGLRKRSVAGDDGYGYLLKSHFLIQ